MKLYFWPGVFAVLAFVLGVVGIRLFPRMAGQSLTDAANFASLAVNLVALLFGLASLIVAGAAYRDAHSSGAQQQEILTAQKQILDQAKDALISVVGQLNDQRNLLDKTLETSSKHLLLVQQAYENEARRLARRPVLRIVVGLVPEDQLDRPIPIQLDANGWGPITFRVINSGDADLEHPIIVLTATPDSIHVDQSGFRMAERPRHNVFQIASAVPIRQSALMVEGGATRTDVEVRVPNDGAAEFDIDYRVFGDGIADVRRSFRFLAVRQR